LTVCIYCIDNDIIQKLATFDLFDETISLFGASNEQINILETAKYKFRSDWKKVKQGRLRNPGYKFVNYERTLELTILRTKFEQVLRLKPSSCREQDLFSQVRGRANFDKIARSLNYKL